jgi:ribonuclease E
VALAVLRGLEDALMQGARASLVATTTAQVALYILNNKRQFIIDMEARNGVSVTVTASDKLQGANFTIERGAASALPQRRPERAAVSMDWGFDGEQSGDTDVPAPSGHSALQDDARDADDEGGGFGEARDERGGEDRNGKRRRRRRGRRSESEGPRSAFDRNDRDEPPRFGRDEDEESEDAGGFQAGRPRSDRTPGERPRGQRGHGDRPRVSRAREGLRQESGAAVEVDGEELPAGEDGGAEFRGGGEGDSDGDRGNRRRRRGRRGGRRGRGRDRGPEGSGDGAGEVREAEGAGHVTEEVIDEFGGAVMPDDMDVMPSPAFVEPDSPTSEEPARQAPEAF